MTIALVVPTKDQGKGGLRKTGVGQETAWECWDLLKCGTWVLAAYLLIAWSFP